MIWFSLFYSKDICKFVNACPLFVQGARIMRTSNLKIKDGLFNGSIGEVVDIIYWNWNLLDVVMVIFNKYTSSHLSRTTTKSLYQLYLWRENWLPLF